MAQAPKLTHAHLPTIAHALQAMGQNPNAPLSIAEIVAAHHDDIRIASEMHKYSFEEIAMILTKALGIADFTLSARSLKDAYKAYSKQKPALADASAPDAAAVPQQKRKAKAALPEEAHAAADAPRMVRA